MERKAVRCVVPFVSVYFNEQDREIFKRLCKLNISSR